MASQRSSNGRDDLTGAAQQPDVEATPPEAASDGAVSGSADTAFEKLLLDAAKLSSPGRLLAPGTQLCDGRFVIRRHLGEGGMGVVFEARDVRRDRTVALKTLSRVDPAGIYRMKREFRSLAGVEHPFLVSPHELFADGELWFFTMDLIEGQRFDDYLRVRGNEADHADASSASEALLRKVLAQLASGVHAIHDAGKLHRDLKPSNVLVSEHHSEPRVAVLDFGLASETSRPGATQTIERGVAGTPAYMAPEQARGERARTESDWYAVGVMLFEVLTGRLPFEGESLAMLMAKQAGDAPQVHTLAPAAPADLAMLCDRLLARDPAARPSATEIHIALGSEQASRSASLAPSASRSGSDPADASEPLAGPPAVTFVGRAREIGLLETALADTNEGKPVLVLVGGPSGIGKTTFVEHFVASAKLRGDAVVLSGHCYQRESVPFKGFDGIIDALSHHLMRLRDKDASRLVPRQPQALCRVFPVLGRVAAISSAPQRRGLPSDPVELRYRAFEALKELLTRLAEERPLILYIDDLQWSDRDSARLLKHLLTPPDPPLLLLLATHRDDEPDAEGLVAVRDALSDADGQAIDVRRITLGALSPAEARRLAQQLIAGSDRVRIERIASEAGGSPFLIGELASAAHREPVSDVVDLQRAVLERVAGLSEVQRAVLQALSVAPCPVDPELLGEVVTAGSAQSERPDVPAALRALVAGRLAREVAGPAELRRTAGSRARVATYHDRIRETLLETLPEATRAAWHRGYAAALQAREPLDLDGLVDHCLGAGDAVRAGRYAQQAAERAVEALAFDRAIALYQTALAHLQLNPDGHAELLVALAEAQRGAGRCGDAARTLLVAAEVDRSREQELQRRAGEQFFINGELAEGEEVIRRVLANGGLDYDALLDPKAAGPAFLELRQRGFAFERRSEADIDPARLATLDTLWAAALGTNYMKNADALPLAYLRLALELGEPFRVARGRALLMFGLEAPLDPETARAVLPDVLAALREVDGPQARAWAALCEASCAFWSGGGDLGRAELLHAEELLTAPGTRSMLREVMVCRGLLLAAESVLGGSTSTAESTLRVLRLAEETGDLFAQVGTRAWLTIFSYGRESRARIVAEIERGLQLADGWGLNVHTGHGLLSLLMLDALDGRCDGMLERIEKVAARMPPERNWWGLQKRFHRALVLLTAARRTEDREAMLARVERDAAVLQRPLTPFGSPVHHPVLAGTGEYLLGQVAAARGQRERALPLLEQAVGLACTDSVFHRFMHVRLGELLGGERGAQLRDPAAADLERRGFWLPGWRDLYATRFED